VSLTYLLTQETIDHFRAAAEHAPKPVVLESPHPYENHTDVRDMVQVKGAGRLLVRFDAKSQTNDDMMTRLAFYRDDQLTFPIAVYKGASHTFQPFVVDGDRFWWRFVSGAGATFWGYKFTVTPLRVRLDDEAALRNRNPALGYYLAELLLAHGPTRARLSVFEDGAALAALGETLLWYVARAGQSSSARQRFRAVRLLARLLRAAASAGVGGALAPLCDRVESLRDYAERLHEVESRVEAPAGRGRRHAHRPAPRREFMHSSWLQSLLELLVSARLATISARDKVSLESATPSRRAGCSC
jgi:hypothetical protein